MSMTVPERLVLLAAEVRALREEGIENHLILDDVESMLKKIISEIPDAPTIGAVIDHQVPMLWDL
jgi:hypothetical protein